MSDPLLESWDQPPPFVPFSQRRQTEDAVGGLANNYHHELTIIINHDLASKNTVKIHVVRCSLRSQLGSNDFNRKRPIIFKYAMSMLEDMPQRAPTLSLRNHGEMLLCCSIPD